ncbi:MAG: F0F1 ATP synthase subunit beta, partial [Kiritimatiellae bacterium]|nr:F0F1 ATP synthase subunit beta [Kiritimatiellia bacterium]
MPAKKKSSTKKASNATYTGTITQVLGAVCDIEFADGKLPNIFNALTCSNPSISDEPDNLTFEVAQHLGSNIVRAIAMDITDGLVRGTEVKDLGRPITMPVGEGTLGRVMNLLGEPIDNAGEIKCDERKPILRAAPRFEDQDTSDSVLVTGIKVIDLLAPYRK